jgi:hypothetical protein
LKGDKESALTITKNMYSEYDKQYDKYLKGKNVAIVGPAFSGYSAGNEIDSFDVVVRIFYRGKSYLPDPEKQGSKVDVSYYNVKCAEMISEGSDYTFFQDLDYAVFKENKHSYQKKLFDADNGRVLFSPNRFLLNGSANMIPLVLYDLLNFNINKIKIFNVNLYLTTHNTYFPGYQIEEKSKKNFTPSWYAFAVHNPMTQFNFIKNLWRTGLIDVDQACENVISMSSQEYMNAMEDIYVNTNPMS